MLIASAVIEFLSGRDSNHNAVKSRYDFAVPFVKCNIIHFFQMVVDSSGFRS